MAKKPTPAPTDVQTTAPTATDEAAKIEGQFQDTPSDWARYWAIEFKASREESSPEWFGIKAWQQTADKVVKRYRSKRTKVNDTRINIFPANIQTQKAILVGNTPKCEVTRRFEDAEDDVARVAALMLERVLNAGLEEESKGFSATIAKCTEDRLLPGMCGSKVSFYADFQEVPGQDAITTEAPCSCIQQPPPDAMPIDRFTSPPDPSCPQCQGTGSYAHELAPAVPPSEKPTNECADADYVHWKDQLWNQARVSDELRWWAFGCDMSRKQLDAFGLDGQAVTVSKGKSKGQDGKKESPWSRARVWEIWSKEHKRVFHYVEGFPRVLFHVDNPDGQDPLGLDDFWPMPIPMIANATTDAFLPTPDFEYAKDLYDEADELTARIRSIVRAIKVAGVYDAANKQINRLLDEACELQLIPVQNWAAFMKDKGGLAGSFQLLPIMEMVETVQALAAQRNTVIEGIYQITGLGDIIRGQQQQSETATTSAIKARFASVRLQDLQKEVARYATDLQRIRKEVIAKHFSIETIIQRSNILQSDEAQDLEGQQRIMQAAQLIKDRHLDFRVSIKPEQISLQDWAQLKQQRSEVLAGLGNFFNSMTPLFQLAMQGGPAMVTAATKFTFRTAQWMVAGMPGAGGVETAFDTFVGEVEKAAEAAAQQPPQPKPPDPKVQGAMIKAQGDIQKTHAATQGRLVEIGAETQAQMAQRQHDAQMDVATTEAQERIKGVHQVDELLGPAQPVQR